MSARKGSALPTLAALALLAAPGALAAPAARAHPDPKGEQECAACHRSETPDAFQAWENGKHGLALVKCVVCHGSTGKDFRPRPASAACQGCHAAQVASLAKRGVKECFACHDPHALTANPHR